MRMKILEVFDYLDNSISWEKHGRFELATFTIKNVQYILQIEKKPGFYVDMNLKGKTVYEVSFFIHGDNSFSTQNNSTSPTKVYGAVLHAFKMKYSLDEYQNFYFSAERRHSTSDKEYEFKIELYENLVSRVRKQHGGYLYHHRTVSGVEFLLTKQELKSKQWVNEHQEMIKKFLKLT